MTVRDDRWLAGYLSRRKGAALPTIGGKRSFLQNYYQGRRQVLAQRVAANRRSPTFRKAYLSAVRRERRSYNSWIRKGSPMEMRVVHVTLGGGSGRNVGTFKGRAGSWTKGKGGRFTGSK